jgi:hypothetical protein
MLSQIHSRLNAPTYHQDSAIRAAYRRRQDFYSAFCVTAPTATAGVSANMRSATLAAVFAVFRNTNSIFE